MNLLRVTGKADVALTPDVSVVSILALVVGLLLSLGLRLGSPAAAG